MFLLFSIAALFMAPSTGASASLSRVTTLKFAPNSFIQYTPDWSRLTSVISVCAWIKDTGSSAHRTFFSYHSNSRIENDSDRTFSKSKFCSQFFENYFFPRFMLPCSLLAKNIFRFFEVHTYPSIHNSGLEVSPGNAISEGMPPQSPLQHELGSGSSRYRKYVSRTTRTENFISQNFFLSFSGN